MAYGQFDSREAALAAYQQQTARNNPGQTVGSNVPEYILSNYAQTTSPGSTPGSAGGAVADPYAAPAQQSNQLGGTNVNGSDPLYQFRQQRAAQGLKTDSTDSNVEGSAEYLQWLNGGRSTGGGSTGGGGTTGTMPGAGGGGVGDDNPNAPKTPDSVASLMNMTGMQGEGSFQFLGNTQGTLRPLGQRLGIQDSGALAGLQRRIY